MRKQAPKELGSIFKKITGRTSIPETPQEIWEAVKETVGVREDLNGKRYDIFPIKKYPDINKTIDKALSKL